MLVSTERACQSSTGRHMRYGPSGEGDRMVHCDSVWTGSVHRWGCLAGGIARMAILIALLLGLPQMLAASEGMPTVHGPSMTPDVEDLLDALTDPLGRGVPGGRVWTAAAARWSCSASCNVQQINRDARCPARTTGQARGPDEASACRDAKRAATQSTPGGCYSRHCQCSCSK